MDFFFFLVQLVCVILSVEDICILVHIEKGLLFPEILLVDILVGWTIGISFLLPPLA